MNEVGYETLADVLTRAYDQAAKGKGKERHAHGEPFDEQVMQDGAKRFGHGALLFQAFKKSEESQRLPHDRAINELLGAIVYLAGAVIALEAKQNTTRETEAKPDNGWIKHTAGDACPVSDKTRIHVRKGFVETTNRADCYDWHSFSFDWKLADQVAECVVPV